MRIRRPPARLLVLGATLLALGCGTARGAARGAQRAVPTPEALRTQPVVQVTRHSMPHPSLARLALAPLEASLDLRRSLAKPGDATGLVTAQLGEALAAEGVSVIPASEVVDVVSGEIADDPAAAASSVARSLGATGVLLGRLQRYEDREGRPLAVTRPASVTFEVTLYSAPEGRKLWTGRFAHTQRSSDQAPLQAARYPGRGTRWLTAEELARWGAGHMARELATRR